MYFLYDFLRYQNGILAIILLFGLLGLAAAVVIAIRRKDAGLAWLAGLSVLTLGLLTGLLFATSVANIYPEQSILLGGLLAFAAGLLALVLRSASFFLEKQPLPGIAMLGLAILLLVGSVPLISGTTMTGQNHMQRGMGGEMVVELEEAVAMDMAMPMAAAPTAQEMSMDEDGTKGTPSQQAPRLRQYFPETLLWLPDALTDSSGNLQVDFTAADSITTWRVTALASTQDGRLGSANTPLRVFQDFFIDIDLPLSLTVGDQVSIPVGIYNYLQEEQTVRLELEQSDWFELQDEASKEITIPANDITVVYFTIKALDFGLQPFQVTAWGSVMSDAVRREVQVYPDGKPVPFSYSDRLEPETPVSQQVLIPEGAVAGTQQLLVKIYPGMVSQVIEGLDSILQMPYGCFEQTSSTTYPNVLVMDYLQQTAQSSPEVQFKAEEYINLGYQRLLTFEVDDGGFSLFGDAPADRMLTAYGLQEFSDMSQVHDVDSAILQRAADWLLSQQSGDGSWENDRGLVHESVWSNLGNDRLPVTAYITWSLLEAGFGDSAGVQSGLDYIREFQSQAEDAYVLALVANALVAGDLESSGELSSSTMEVLDRLAGMAQSDGSVTYWDSGVATMMGSEGSTASVETTALAAIVFQKAGEQPELVRGALTYIIQSKDPYGTWYTTQATVLSLKALLQSLRNDAENTNVTVTVTLNGGQTRTVQVTPDNFDVVQLLSFDDINIGNPNTVEITAKGSGSLMYQITGSYYLPWAMVEASGGTTTAEAAVIDVAYDRSELSVNDLVGVTVTVTLTEAGGLAESAMIDLGLPPGFTLQSEDLDALVNYYNDTPEDYAFPTIERYETTGRQILIYTRNLSAENPLTFTYHLRARFPLSVQTPASQTYDYYNPDVAGEQAPQLLVVNP